jgi:hypothetical protein
MIFELKSTKLKRTVSFYMADSGGHVYLGSGTDGRQICGDGHFMGRALSATPQTFERVCRRWWRYHLERTRNE